MKALKRFVRRSFVGRAILRRRLAKRIKTVTELDQPLFDFYSSLVHRDDLCFDIGANFGIRTNILSRLCQHVVALEPQESCFRFLRKAFATTSNVTLVQKAVGAREGEAEMLISDEQVLSTLSRSWLQSVAASGRFAGVSWKRLQKVKVTTLDTLVREFGRPRFIKIDVEGFEREVITGLSKPVDLVSFEFTPEYVDAAKDCIEMLGRLGRISLNYSSAESMVFAFNEWMQPAEMVAKLDSMREDVTEYGDVFVRCLYDRRQ